MIFARFFHQSPALCLIPGGDKCMKSHAWEQRKFGEMANRRSEVSASGNLPRVEYEDIVSGTGTLNKDVFEKQSQKQGIVFHSGDVLYGKLRPYLQNWLLASFNGLAVGDFWVLEPQGLNSNYLYRIIQTKQFDEIANQSVGTKMPRADWKLVSKATFLNPASFNEQRLIGKFFKDIDSLLTLHQRKWVEFFYPTYFRKFSFLNFWEFFNNRITNAWEQRKIGDYLTLSKIPGHTGVDAKKLTVKLWGKGVVEKTDIYGGSQNTQYYVRRAGQFMYGKLDFLHAAFGIVPKSLDRFESTLDSPAFDLHEIDGAFLQNRVTQQNFYLKFGNIANGSRKAKRIHEVTFLDMPIVVPSYAEQKKIGAFLNKLDSLLTLHQRQSVSSDLLGASLHL